MTQFLPSWRTLLPAEHGSWFMLGFPLVLGLLLRPGLPALCLALAALACFLGRPPLRRVLRGPKDPRQLRALLLCSGLAGTFGGLTLLLAGPRFLLPLAALAPLILLALRADLQRSARSLPVELAAQGAFAGLAATMLVAGGSPFGAAAQIWLCVTLLGGANLAHVRSVLGQAHQANAADLRGRRRSVHGLHLLLVLASALLLAPRGLPGLLWTGWTALLYLRALAPYRPLPARTLGWREGGLSVLSLLLLWGALA